MVIAQLLLMESQRGSSFTGQGFEVAVVLAMQRMGFTVQSNKLLDNTTSQFASEKQESKWEKYILAKEYGKGNTDLWWRRYNRPPHQDELQIRCPNVTEVDVMAQIGALTEVEAESEDRFSGFSVGGTRQSIRDFRQLLTGRSWLIEISGPSGDSQWARDKGPQLIQLLRHAARRGYGEGVALFYNGRDSLAAAPVWQNLPDNSVLMMHFLQSEVWALPLKLMRDQRDAKDRVIQAKDRVIQTVTHEKDEKDAAIRRLTVATVALAVCLVVALARKGR